MIAPTSTGPAGAAPGGAEAGADCAVGDAGVAAAEAGAAAAADDEWPKMADIMFPKTLIAIFPEFRETA